MAKLVFVKEAHYAEKEKEKLNLRKVNKPITSDHSKQSESSADNSA